MKKKNLMTTLALAMTTLTAGAQDNPWLQDVKLSGFGMVQYQSSDKKHAPENGFNLRLVRVALEGRAHSDFYWKAQMQVNGNTYDPDKSGTDIRLVDLFAEWQRFDFLRVKAGQFKRPFTFENPMHPITQGFMSYSQNVSKLVGYSDRTGEQGSNGRDMGLQVQGDVVKLLGHYWLHYQVGVFNGEGINQKDKNNQKDLIGGLWVMPVEGLRVGAFGWVGSRSITYAGNTYPYFNVAAGTPVNVKKNRYAFSAEYAKDDWTLRSEYIHSQGYGADLAAGDKADGFYALCIAPILKEKLHVKARYDLYRDQKNWATSRNLCEIGADYMLTKNLQLNVEYARVNERVNHSNYNIIDAELNIRF